MLDNQKFIAARARLHALCDNLPSFVYERHVHDYNGVLKEIEESTEYDLSAFKISEDRLEHPIVSVVRRSYSGRPGSVTRGKEKKCDDAYFANQVRAAREFLREMRRETAPPIVNRRDYWSMTDDQLAELAEPLGILIKLLPHMAGPGRSPRIDRDYIIRHLVQRDQILFAGHEAPVTFSIQGGIHGSTIQTASPNATATTNSAIDVRAIGEIVAKLKAEKDGFGLAEPLRTQFDSNIETIEQELAAPEPRPSVLRSSLDALKTVLLNLGGGVAANAIWAEIAHYLASHPR
jgi:hypothetical protein